MSVREEVIAESTITVWRQHEKTSYDADILRGIAALGVVIFHFSLAFLSPKGFGRPAVFPVINGSFCVMIFFVLSSFVLTNKHLTRMDRPRVILAIIKRWPRLLPLTILGTTLPAVLFVCGVMANHKTSLLIGSDWLDRSAGIKNFSHYTSAPTIIGGVKDGVVVFARGISRYNSAMWTMKWELAGSVFALFSSLLIGSRRRPLADAGILALPTAVAYFINPLVAVCVTTVYLTKYVLWRPAFLNLRQAIALIAFGLLCAIPYGVGSDRAMETLYGVGATVLFIGLRNLPSFRRGEWPIGRFLGRISFPLYVIHLPVLASAASLIILTNGYNYTGLISALAAMLAVSFVLAWGLAFFDIWWMKRLNVLFAPDSSIGRTVSMLSHKVTRKDNSLRA